LAQAGLGERLYGMKTSIPTMQTIQLSKRLVYLITKDGEFGEFMSHQLSHFGYLTKTVRDLQSLENVIAGHASIAILVDLTTIEILDSGQSVHDALFQLGHVNTPLFFISENNNQEIRLQAVRAGGVAFFSKPVDVVGIVDKLDKQEIPTNEDPYRVLIVEDQIPVANYYQMVLRMAGMDAQVVTDSTQVLSHLFEFHPDLILMDLYMPNVSGAELATIIRQMDEYVSIPIVFLSSEDDFSKHIEMMSLGSDDFFTKPIKASHLVALVKGRLERLKILRSYMVRDSLTGLLNHSSFRMILAQEVNRCKRQENRLALAMLDVDHFKKVNDTFGHATGDLVLKGLSRLLKQRLRKSDIIGRYGGEEFVALLLDATPEEASKIMDELRIHFSQMEFFPTPNNKVSVTFSAGVASFPELPTSKQLSDAADKALYEAKAAGRNRIVMATRSLSN
jgi:diguanylate cyclase (GGDEF)-like protein